MRTYRGDCEKFLDMIKRRQPFGLSRYNDGEIEILRNVKSTLGNYEFDFDPQQADYAACRQMLMDALTYRHPTYYVGIGPPDAVGEDDFHWQRETSGQDEEHLTFGNLFFYANYAFFLDEYLPRFADFDVYLVCHETSAVDRLPFPVKQVYWIGYDAWLKDHELIGRMQEDIRRQQITDSLYLFCAGPFGSILAHRLHAAAPRNIYVDTGSALDPFFYDGEKGRHRRYLRQTEQERQARVSQWIEPAQ